MGEAFRACDSRFPFFWTDSSQPSGRWHALGEGPCAYLSTSAKGAWAEVLRHEGITDPEDVSNVERALWSVEAATPAVEPDLGLDVLTGGLDSYRECQETARRLRASGHRSLRSPTAALVSGVSERYRVRERGELSSETTATETWVVFGEPFDLAAMPLAKGCASPEILLDVRPL